MEANPYQSPSASGNSFAPEPVRSITLPVTCDYYFGPDDMLSWCRFFYYGSSTGRRQRLQVFVLTAFLYLFAAVVVALLTRSVVGVVVPVGAALIAIFLTPRWFDRRLSKVYKSMLDSASFAGSFGRYQLTLSDAGVRETSPAGELFVKWPFVIGASRKGDHIFIQMANGHGAVLQRESFAGPISFEEIIPIVCQLADQAKPATAKPNR